MLNRISSLALATAIAVSAIPAWAEDVTIATATGEATLPANPATIAVLHVAAIDTLSALGVTIAGVPDNVHVPYLEEVAAKATRVGTLFEPSLETIATLGPDLITSGSRSSTKVEALSPIAQTIDMTIWADVVGEGRARIEAYGKLFDKEDKAAEMLAALDAKTAEVAAAVKGKGNALILLTNGPKVSAYGKGSRFGWIHDSLGLAEAYPSLDPQTHGDSVSFKFIAKVNPDWIILIDRSAAVGEPASASTLDNPLVAGTKAAQNGHIVTISSGPVYIAGGGYQSLMITLDELLATFSK